MEVDEALVDAELVEIPGLGTLTARGLASGDLEVLGGQADGALDGEALAAGALNELGADLLERLNLSASQGDSDAVALLSRVLVVVFVPITLPFLQNVRAARQGPSRSSGETL